MTRITGFWWLMGANLVVIATLLLAAQMPSATAEPNEQATDHVAGGPVVGLYGGPARHAVPPPNDPDPVVPDE